MGKRMSLFKTPYPPQKPALSALPPDLVSIADYQRYAKEIMPPAVYAYVSGGAADGITKRRNRSALEQIGLVSDLLASFSDADTRCGSGGMTLNHPLMLAPVAHQALYHSEGERATARAASQTQTPMIVSTLASTPLEDIQAEGDSPKWFQLYWQPRREDNLALLQRAADAGYEAIVITLDAPVTGARNESDRAGFVLPSDAHPNLMGVSESGIQPITAGQSPILQGAMAQAPSREDLIWLRKVLPLPLLAKGVMSARNASVLKTELGFDGVIVSNHGGRNLDTQPASIEALPAIRQTVGKDYPVLLDSGIRRGTDVFKAIALGADAVLIGRPQAWALGVAGETGVAHMLSLLKHELELCMALVGCPRLSLASPEFLCSLAQYSVFNPLAENREPDINPHTRT